MKASELVEKINKEIALTGDNEVWLMVSLGKDEGGVSRVKASNDISVNTGWVNETGSDKIVETVIHIKGK